MYHFSTKYMSIKCQKSLIFYNKNIIRLSNLLIKVIWELQQQSNIKEKPETYISCEGMTDLLFNYIFLQCKIIEYSCLPLKLMEEMCLNEQVCSFRYFFISFIYICLIIFNRARAPPISLKYQFSS